MAIINWYISIFVLIYGLSFSFILKMLVTNIVWAIISNKIKPKSTNRLKNLYKSNSKFIPKKIECKMRNNAEPTPNIKKYLFSDWLLIFLINIDIFSK